MDQKTRPSYIVVYKKPLYFIILFAPLHSMWDLSSLTGNGTHAPCSGHSEDCQESPKKPILEIHID